MNYKIAFVGLGSIATRHLKNVAAFLINRGDTFSVDLYRSQIRPLPEALADIVKAVYLYEDELPVDRLYDIVFVTNPTSLHYETIDKFYKNTKSFFIEKPVFDGTCVDETIFEKLKNIKSYVACPLRYNTILQYVRENVDLKDVIAVRAISSSYLPDWRPGQDYRKTYSAHRELGGGVGIDLIHEWDYLTWLFGFPQELYSIRSKISNLEIDSDDIAIYIAKNGNMTIELHLDYFGRSTVRTLDLFTINDTIHCDLIAGTMDYLRGGEKQSFENERNAFQKREIAHFFDIFDNNASIDSTPEHAYKVLKLAKGEL